MQTYWQVDYGRGRNGDMYATRAEAIREANDWWADTAEEYNSDDLCNGREYTYDVALVQLDEDENELKREPYTCSFEYYHGDRKEHGTWGSI